MPQKPNTPFKHPGCAALVPPGRKYCDKHTSLHTTDWKSTAGCGYDGRWRKARARFLREHPQCVLCLKKGRLTEATVVDHIKHHRGDP